MDGMLVSHKWAAAHGVGSVACVLLALFAVVHVVMSQQDQSRQCADNHFRALLLQGIIINGCIRDSQDIAGMEIGVKALGTHPLKSSKRDPGLRDVAVSFAGMDPGVGQSPSPTADDAVGAACP
jgi:Aldolase/RraA